MTWSELRAKCKRQSDYIITLFITNEVSLFITWLLSRTRITPNQVTLASIGCGILCAAFYANGIFLGGSFFLFFSHVFDCTDGNLARAKEMFSSLGKWLDMFGDRFSESILFMGIGVYFFRMGSPAWVLITLIDGLLLLLYYYIVDLSLVLGMSKPVQNIGKLKIKDVRVKWGLMEPMIYGFIVLSSIGLIKVQLVLLFASTSAGLVYQGVKVLNCKKES